MTTTHPDPTTIRTALERATRAMALRESVGKGTAVTKIQLGSGLRCEVEEGDFRLATDMSPMMGGSGTAPTPGVLGRAAIGTCFATSFAMWAARCGVAFTRIEVDVEADFDARGELGVDDAILPGYLGVRLAARVVSDAPQDEIERLLEMTERHTSWLDNMRRPVDTQLAVTIVREG